MYDIYIDVQLILLLFLTYLQKNKCFNWFKIFKFLIIYEVRLDIKSINFNLPNQMNESYKVFSKLYEYK